MSSLRWVPESDRQLLLQMWRISKCHSSSRHERMQYVARHYHKHNPTVSVTAAYKDLEVAIS